MSNELTYESVLELIKESNRMLTEKFQEFDKKILEMDKKICDLEKSDANFSYKNWEFDDFDDHVDEISEGVSISSVYQELIEKFEVDSVTTNIQMSNKYNDILFFDLYAETDSIRNEIYIVEVEKTLDKEILIKFENTLKKFRIFTPYYKDKKLYGIISAIKAPKNLIEEVNKHGFYFATVKEGLFKVEIPKGFIPKVF